MTCQSDVSSPFRIEARKPRTRRRTAFTLLELLAVIGVLGILLAMLLPAIQAAREAARRVQCRDNLKQIGLAMLNHHDIARHFPTGGWGHEWVGIPGRGAGTRQPGGWIYNVLPYLDEEPLYNLGRGMDRPEFMQASASRLQTTVAIMNCPSRRGSEVWPTVAWRPHLRNPKETATVYFVARSDYAINSGDFMATYFGGPPTLKAGDGDFPWPDMSQYTGVCYLRSEVRLNQIFDGTTKTYLVGEKYLNPENYVTGEDPGDNESMYVGYCADTHRFATTEWPPLPDRRGTTDPFRFGSAHREGCQFVMCDGSVQTIDYAIDPIIHTRLANRRDGQHLSLNEQ